MLRLYLRRTVSTVKSDTRSGREKRGFSRALGGGAALVFTRQALAVGAGDRAGAGADAGAQPGKPQAVARPALGAGTGVHSARPWVQALVQRWASTRQGPGSGGR